LAASHASSCLGSFCGSPAFIGKSVLGRFSVVLSASGSDLDATSQSLLNPGFRRKHGGKTWGSVTGDFTTERQPGQFRLSGPGCQRHVQTSGPANAPRPSLPE